MAKAPALDAAARLKQIRQTAEASAAPAVHTPPPPPAEPEHKASRPDREGKSLVAAHVNKHAAKQLRMLAVEQDTTVQALVVESLNLLFKTYGKPQIAE
jgi:hypothetical protein